MNHDPINHPDAFTPPTGELDPAERELILLVNKHGSPAAVRALVELLNGRASNVENAGDA